MLVESPVAQRAQKLTFWTMTAMVVGSMVGAVDAIVEAAWRVRALGDPFARSDEGDLVGEGVGDGEDGLLAAAVGEQLRGAAAALIEEFQVTKALRTSCPD